MFSYSLNSLIVFCAVAKMRSFSKAANILFMTQPGVSNHVAQLEAQTGTMLLKREKGKFQLTKEGKMVFKYAEKIETVARGLESTIKAIKKDAKPLLKIAITPVYSRVMMPFILGSFQKAYPDIMIKLDLGNSDDMLKTVVNMQNDVAVLANQMTSQKVFAFPLLKEELVLITCNDHPLSTKESVSLQEIAEYPLVIREEGSSTRKVVLSALESMKITPPVLIDVRSTEFIKEWVSQGKGVSILIKRAVMDDERKYLKVIPLKENLSLKVSVLFLKSKKYDTSIQKFVDHIAHLKAESYLQQLKNTIIPA
ncbi:MAG: LysR family transcriptional regulator [Proteobacteria bacterium]|nr:LysR family transcriptional regulator [Pseudomonadota bacterium]